MADEQQNNQSSVDTNKIPKVTQEMLDTFADPKPKEEPSLDEEINQEEDKAEATEPVAEISENPSEDKTVVEFSEDKIEEEKKPAKPKRFGFFQVYLF